MKVLIVGLILLLFGFIITILLWRIPKIYHRPWIILIIFGCVFLFWLIIDFVFTKWFIHLSRLKFSMWESMQLSLFYGSASITFFIFYTSIIDPSPSLTIIRMLLKSDTNGLEKEAFLDFFRNDILVLPRLDSLVQTKMAIKDGNFYTITPGGREFVKWLVRIPHKIFPIGQGEKTT